MHKFKRLDAQVRECEKMVERLEICYELALEGRESRIRNEYKTIYSLCGIDPTQITQLKEQNIKKLQELQAIIKKIESQTCVMCEKPNPCNNQQCAILIAKLQAEAVIDFPTKPRQFRLKRDRRQKAGHFVTGEQT